MRTLAFIALLVLVLAALPFASAQDKNSALPITLTDATGTQVTIESLDRIASGSGDVTEIINALGFYDHLVAVDATSTYPPQALAELTEIGFARALTAETIIATNPSVFFCSQTCGPDAVFEQLRGVGIPVVIIPDSEDGGLELPFPKITMVSQALGVPERGAALSARVEREIEWSQTALANVSDHPSVFYFYIRVEGLQLAVGTGTPGDAMIKAAGAINAGAEAGVVGYQALSAEIILTAFPDWLLLNQGNVDSLGGVEEVLKVQGLRATPAAQNGNIIVMDTEYLGGMSVRTGQAIFDLAVQLHPDMTWEREVSYPYTYTDATGTEITIAGVFPLIAADDNLLELTQQLGFNSLTLNDPVDGAFPTVIASLSDDWQLWRDAGDTVIVVSDDVSVEEVAAALNIPGRGEALLAKLAAQ